MFFDKSPKHIVAVVKIGVLGRCSISSCLYSPTIKAELVRFLKVSS